MKNSITSRYSKERHEQLLLSNSKLICAKWILTYFYHVANAETLFSPILFILLTVIPVSLDLYCSKRKRGFVWSLTYYMLLMNISGSLFAPNEAYKSLIMLFILSSTAFVQFEVYLTISVFALITAVGLRFFGVGDKTHTLLFPTSSSENEGLSAELSIFSLLPISALL